MSVELEALKDHLRHTSFYRQGNEAWRWAGTTEHHSNRLEQSQDLNSIRLTRNPMSFPYSLCLMLL